jgi:hypothetical protein
VPPVGTGPGLTLVDFAPGGPPLAGLTLWLNGRAGITTGTTFTWADQSGAGFGPFTATGSNMPANGGSINGRNAITFALGNNLTNSTSSGADYVGASPYPYTFAAVFKCTSAVQLAPPGTWTSPKVFTLDWPGVTIGADLSTFLNSSAPTTLCTHTGTSNTLNNFGQFVDVTGALAANPHYAIATFNSSSVLGISVDGGIPATLATGLPGFFNAGPSNSRASVGNGGNSTLEEFAGQIGEVMVWNRALSSAEQTALGAFFVSEWGTLGP